MSVSAAGVSEIALALLTTMSRPPKRAAGASIAVLTAASSRTSTTSGSALPPAFSIASAAVWIVPSSLGCGVSVLAAIATLAPSRAARSAIASPIPREAPVMNKVLPLSDIVLPLAREEGLERRLRFRRAQALAEDPGFLIDVKLQFVLIAAHQCTRSRNRPGRQPRDLARRLKCFGVNILRVDHHVGDAVLPGMGRVEWMTHDQKLERAALADQPRQNESRSGFRDQPEANERSRKHRVGAGDHKVAMQQHGGSDA